MEMNDLHGYAQQNAEAFAASDTFAAFAAALDGSKPGPGKLLQSIEARYPGQWERGYQTLKTHGFLSRALLLPTARKASDVFKSVSLYPFGAGGRYREETPYVAAGACFVSEGRARGFAYFGKLGARYAWSPEWLKRGEKIRYVSGGQDWLTGAVPSDALVAAYGAGPGADDWDMATIEAIRWSDGRILITVNCHNGFGSRWVALLDANESVLPMLSDHERGEIEAEYTRQREAWGEDKAA